MDHQKLNILLIVGTFYFGGCGGQGYYFWPNPRVITKKSTIQDFQITFKPKLAWINLHARAKWKINVFVGAPCIVPDWHALFIWWLRNGSQSKDSFLLGWQITIKTCCRKQTITSSSFSDILESLTCGLVVGLLSFWKGSDAMIFFIHYRSNIFLTCIKVQLIWQISWFTK